MSDPIELDPLPEAPLVSVIIPCYKQAHFLPQAIESALHQTHQRVEIVVIDDGSPDATSKVASSYEGVRCVRQDNRGLSGARNRGLLESVGECLVFLDADDRLRPQAIEIGLRHLKGCRAAAFSYGSCALIDVDGHFLSVFEPPSVEGDHYQQLLQGNCLPNPAAMIYRRDTLVAVGGFRPELRAVEDYDLSLRLTKVYSACGHRDLVADYRQHGTSLSRNLAAMSDSMLSVLQAQVAHVSRNREYEKALRRGMRKWRKGYYTEQLVARARQNARGGHWGLVARDALSLLRANPRMLLENALRKVRVEWSRNK